MKLKHLLYIAFVGMSLAACSSDDNIVNDISANKAKVNINLTRSEIDATLDSRATSEMPINSANLMYNLILLHYNSNQVLVEVSTDTNADLSNGLFEETWAPTLTAGDDDYIVLLANVKQSNDVLGTLQGWNDLGADRFANLRDAMVKDLPLTANSDGSYNSDQKMFMLGYYKGAVTNGMSLNIMMGRMASCIKLVIAPASGSTTITKVQIDNAVMNTHYFPATSTDNLVFGSYSDTPGLVASADSPATLYYYTGENINPSASQYTTATITATGSGTTTYTFYYSNNTTETGKTKSDVTTNGNQSLTADPYYNPRYYGQNISKVSGWYQHRYKYTAYYYFRGNKEYDETGYCFADSQPDDKDYTYTLASNYRRYIEFELADHTSLASYYPYYFSSSTSVGGVTYSARGYKHRFYVATTTGGTSKTYTVKLGSDSPTKANRNYSLYRNNTYTFNINLQ